ncbi:MAG: protein kinase, partial [Gemmatimonadetes bacterium]|nr:protein kinase [Gemmatimonadota bacterium]NIO31413.1 protein kinase [Gemmatimonadota bacterium]
MTDDSERIEAALADRYAIERGLGSGGMATVYLARDLKHGRQVAVKVLRPEVAAAVGSDRFLREIGVAARLNHPHILPLLDSGEADSFLYYVMPHVAGGSLRRRLADEARLPLEAVLRIARQVASALDLAHRHGVVHRDVKPENILFSEGLAVVADFGIAKAVSAAEREVLTRTGVPLGTPGYMSPEQAMGVAELDERTDVYSLGCVVYEMLTGGTPVVLPSPDDARLGRFLDAPPEHRERLDGLPGRIEQTLVKALAARP